MRRLGRGRALRVLTRMQPGSLVRRKWRIEQIFTEFVVAFGHERRLVKSFDEVSSSHSGTLWS